MRMPRLNLKEEKPVFKQSKTKIMKQEIIVAYIVSIAILVIYGVTEMNCIIVIIFVMIAMMIGDARKQIIESIKKPEPENKKDKCNHKFVFDRQLTMVGCIHCKERFWYKKDEYTDIFNESFKNKKYASD